jgi:hypothetical protein
MSKASRPHDDAVVELLHKDPAFADEYLSVALDEANQPGGREAFWQRCAILQKRKV